MGFEGDQGETLEGGRVKNPNPNIFACPKKIWQKYKKNLMFYIKDDNDI